MRSLYAGSRDFTDYHLILHTMREQLHRCWTTGENLTIIHGAAQGADLLAAQAAAALGLEAEPHPAQWQEYGRKAGPIRNREMLESGIDNAHAFISKPLEESKGTQHMVKIARKAGVPVTIHHSEETDT